MSEGLDELSIDSATNKKVLVANGNNVKMVGATSTIKSIETTKSDMTTNSAAQKTHFRIDWRQLTYFQKEQRSCLSEIFCKKQPENQQQHHALYTFDEANEDEDDIECEGDESHSYCGWSRTSDPKSSPKRRPILNSLDGCFKSGELNAILGPSGAGKSTFLSALFGNKQESSYGQTKVTWFHPPGHEHAGHEEVPQKNPSKEQQRSIRIAFLPQHDHLLNHLTVYETLMFASKIKNPHQSSDKLFHRQNVKRVAKMLKLTDCFNTRCGRLSGGQYKRVSIGQELLSEPDVIILDEPTSGLDAMTCLTTVRTLKSIVMKHPISIILTIHQPDIDVFNLFDQVYVIAQGGMAIYEGPPQDIVPTLAQVNLFMPCENYNPARFIVENAFVADLEAAVSGTNGTSSGASGANLPDSDAKRRHPSIPLACGINEEEEEVDTSSTEDDELEDIEVAAQKQGLLRRSISSLTDALSGKTPDLNPDHLLGKGGNKQFRDSGRRPLLNIGIQTSDGKLITSDQLMNMKQIKAAQLESQLQKQQIERLQLLRRLNQMQKEKYYTGTTLTSGSCVSSDILSQRTTSSVNGGGGGGGGANHGHSTRDDRPTSASSKHSGDESSVTDSSSWSEARETIGGSGSDESRGDENSSIASTSSVTDKQKHESAGVDHYTIELGTNTKCGSNSSGVASSLSGATTLKRYGNNQGDNPGDECVRFDQMLSSRRGRRQKLRRQFDKRLSAKHIQSKQSDYPIWYHSFLLTHRTWLSIVRDPIFFGIQFTMHTTIPILLALIFGSQQEEGCPQVGNFDLVQFAYSDQANFIHSTMRSIRQSIGNIGTIFFEMFVLSFAINCITALVFPLDMYVLLKEYRNGWYSLRSYFFGRTLADLPVPIVLHSMAMSILYYLTGQPLSWWRFLAIIGIVILASLVAQSVGLTIGALLMRSSQSAVLAAAGIVAPFFALSGFIVRIHTLPWVAKWAAQGSYLYHLLNGFIIMRYGFGRCKCDDEDFEPDTSHEIPANLKTMASMWIGTYSNEFEGTAQMQNLAGARANRTNLDPNIDIIDKLMGAFKMANSFGHKVENCDDVLPYPMLDFNLKDSDIWHCCLSLLIMLLISRMITFSAIYYKIRSFS